MPPLSRPPREYRVPDVQEEDDIPETDEEEVMHEGEVERRGDEEGESDEPEAKRPRTMTYLTVGVDERMLGVLVASLEQVKAGGVGARKVRGSWADMTEEEEEESAQERRVRFEEGSVENHAFHSHHLQNCKIYRGFTHECQMDPARKVTFNKNVRRV